MSLYEVTKLSQIAELQTQQKNPKCLLFFWASWQEASKLGGPLHTLFQALSQKHGAGKENPCLFLRIEAEAVPECSELYGVTVVPSFIALNGNKVIGERLEGANPSAVSKLLSQLQQSTAEDTVVSSQVTQPPQPVQTVFESPQTNVTPTPAKENSEELNARIKSIISSGDVVLFMKGEPSAPRCGFSRQIVEILNKFEVDFKHFDILTDQDIRAGLKIFSDWPTYPQLYAKEEFVGGLDIVKEIVSGCGENKEEFKSQIGL